MNILFLGPQGSGKGTQAHLVREKFNMKYFDMGAFLRDVAKTNSEVKTIIESGELISDERVNELAIDYLSENNMFDGVIFDGYPRRVGQLTALQNFLEQNGKKLDCTVYLHIPEEETISRLSARRIDQKTGEIYNLITNPPGEDVNPSDLQQRIDDQPEAIKERLLLYHKDTEPLIELLKASTNFIEIDGTQTIEEIHEQAFKALSNYDKSNA